MYCYKCKQDKPEDCFAWKNKEKGIRTQECKQCKNDLNRKFYNKNKQREIERVQIRRDILIKWIIELKSSLKCEVCGETFIYCLEFHHPDFKAKEMNISNMAHRGWSKERILKEIKKCIVLCANCHRKEHYKDKI